jgi:aminoglycoside phosphotransferase (APT) family kinase protein
LRTAQGIGASDASLAIELARLTAYPAPIETESWRAVAALEGAVLDKSEDAAASSGSSSAAATPNSRSFDADRFERYLQQHELGGKAVCVVECRPLAGGRSKQTILVTLQGAKGLPSHIVVRQDWASAVTGTSVISEFALLRSVFDAGLRVPHPLLLEKSPEPLGAPFIVVTRMAGGPQGDIFNPPRSEKLALQVAEQLATLHRLPTKAFSEIGVPAEAYSETQLRDGLQSFRQLNDKLGLPSRTIEIAIEWLQQNISRVSSAQSLVHNDLGFHNFLIEGEELVAILDWELAHIGNPAADFGYIRDWICQMTSWSRFMESYRAAGGPEVDQATLDFYTLWCGVRLYCLLLQARAGVAMGAVKDTEITFAVAQFLPILLHRISRQLRAILDGSEARAHGD